MDSNDTPTPHNPILAQALERIHCELLEAREAMNALKSGKLTPAETKVVHQNAQRAIDSMMEITKRLSE